MMNSPARSPVRSRDTQGGAFLLEALVGLLIFSFGILGIVALQAQSIRFTNDAEVRAEVTYQVNSLISTMWTKYDPKNAGALQTAYASPSGPGYVQFHSDLAAALPPGVTLPVLPLVTVDDATSPLFGQSTTSSIVFVQVVWQMPGDTTPHNYAATGVIGLN